MNKRIILGVFLLFLASALFSACSINEQCPAYAQHEVEQEIAEQRI
ncbi:MAG: hypothetical protein R6U66_08480 [Bacteroidales bacterium]|jgi:outer membrane biogenesis lipoprotein LolB